MKIDELKSELKEIQEGCKEHVVDQSGSYTEVYSAKRNILRELKKQLTNSEEDRK